jgi:hypothetical protein
MTGATPFFMNFSYYPYFQPDLAETNNTIPDVSTYVSALANLCEEL